MTDKINDFQTIMAVPFLTAEDKQRQELREQRQKKLADNYPTLRDSFAMAALSGLVQLHGMSPLSIAEGAYLIADELMKKRTPE